MSIWKKQPATPHLFRKLTKGGGFAVFLSSKIAVALTLFVLVMSIGITGFLIFTSHKTGVVKAGLADQLEELQSLDQPTEEQLTEKARIEMMLDEDTFFGEVLLAGYMTSITITTVGFDDVVRDYAYEFMSEKWQRAYNIWVTCFVIIAYMVILYVNANFVAYLVGSRLAETMKRRSLLKSVSRLSNHYIICGCKGAGSVVINELLRVGLRVVGIDSDVDPSPDLIKRRGFYYFSQDQTDEKLLNDVGIRHAAGFVSLLPDASANLYLTLTAHLLNDNLKVISRAVGSESEAKLALVGADASFTPSIAVGSNLVADLFNQDTMDFIERMIGDPDHDCRMEEYTIKKGCPSIGATFGELDLGRISGARIFAVMKADKRIVYNPGFQYSLEEEDILLTIESPEQLKALARRLERGRKRRWRKKQ
ncbi:MAG: NAD-binding protein [Candidatus Fermentibacteraceae bacterium]|nr:NAD-binding protein [Candidatus Fermentibacteraceae bacterium]